VIAFALSTNQTAWWITIGVVLVVALVVWGLLELLRRTVNEVDRSVSQVWTMGKRVAQNTQTTYLLQTTKARGVELLEELEAHRSPPPSGGPAQPPSSAAEASRPPASASGQSQEAPQTPQRAPQPPGEIEQKRRFPWTQR
jgi:hypothetical protein